VAQEVCLALLSVLPSYRDMGRPFGAFVFGVAAHKVGTPRAAPPARRCRPGPARPARPALARLRALAAHETAAHEGRTGELGALGPAQRRSQ
jgi:RNA polymerase sigma-70 factor (ECF subfamily)